MSCLLQWSVLTHLLLFGALNSTSYFLKPCLQIQWTFFSLFPSDSKVIVDSVPFAPGKSWKHGPVKQPDIHNFLIFLHGTILFYMMWTSRVFNLFEKYDLNLLYLIIHIIWDDPCRFSWLQLILASTMQKCFDHPIQLLPILTSFSFVWLTSVWVFWNFNIIFTVFGLACIHIKNVHLIHFHLHLFLSHSKDFFWFFSF